MRRATVTLPDDLAEAVDRFTASGAAAPSFTKVVQAALRRFLAEPEGQTPDPSVLRRVLGGRTELKEAAARHGASNLRLFGSIARGEGGPLSDVDILVSWERDRTLFDLARLRAELAGILGVPVDVVSETGLDEEVRDEILAEAIAL